MELIYWILIAVGIYYFAFYKKGKKVNFGALPGKVRRKGPIWIGAVIGGLIGILFNIKGELLFTKPSSYTFMYNPIAMIALIVLGAILGWMYSRRKKGWMIGGIAGGAFAVIFAISNIASQDSFSIGSVIFKKIIFFPLGEFIYSFLAPIALIGLFIQWAIIGAIIGYIIIRR